MVRGAKFLIKRSFPGQVFPDTNHLMVQSLDAGKNDWIEHSQIQSQLQKFKS